MIHIKCYKIRLFSFFITKRDVLYTSPSDNAHAFCFCFFFSPKDKGYESTCYFSCKRTVFLSKASQCAYYIWINAVMYGALIITLISTTQLNVLWHWGAQHLSVPKHCVQLWLFFHNDFHFHNSGLLLH